MTSSTQSRLGTAPEEGCKAPCVTVATSNITLSGEQTIGLVAVTAGDRVLVSDQTDSTENGIYNVSTTAWTLATDWNKANDVVSGILIPVSSPTKLYQAVFTGDFTAGTTSISFTENLLANTQQEFATKAALAASSLLSGVSAKTTGYYDGWAAVLEPKGGADYTIATLAEVRAQKGDGAWVPDELIDFTIANGNIAMINWVSSISLYQAGAKGLTGGGGDDVASIEAIIIKCENKEWTIPADDFNCSRTLYLLNGTIRGVNREYSRILFTEDVVGTWLKASTRLQLYDFGWHAHGTTTTSGFINPPSTNDAATDAPNDPATGLPYRGGARIFAENVEMAGWGLDGWRINNGSLSCFNSCFGTSCGRDGLSIGGADANAIVFINYHGTSNTGDGWTLDAKLDTGADSGRSYQTVVLGGYCENNSGSGWSVTGTGHSFNGIGGEGNTTAEYSLLANASRTYCQYIGAAGFDIINSATADSNTIIGSELRANLRFPSGGLIMNDGTDDLFRVRRVTGWDYIEAIDGIRWTTGSAAFGDSGYLLEFKSNTLRPNGAVELGTSSQSWPKGYIDELRVGDGTTRWLSGSGTPEGVESAVVGSLYTDTGGGAGTVLYVKESGGGGNTGWVSSIANTVSTFADLDDTPSVAGGNAYDSYTNTLTITDFDGGTAGQEITVVSKAAITYDTTGTDLTGSSVDIVTAAGDITKWYTGDGTTWILTAFVDVSVDNSGGA